MSRDKYIYLPANERSKIVRDSKEDICIYNHINAGGGEGVEIIHSIFSDGKLVTKIARGTDKQGQKFRRVFIRKGKTGKDYYYIHRLTGNVETIIVEYGFADNDDDIERLKSNWKLYAEAVVKVVCEFNNEKYSLLNNKQDIIDEIVYLLKKYKYKLNRYY